MVLVVLVALLPGIAMAQDIDDMFDTLTYLLGKTLNIRYSIRNAHYVISKEHPTYVRFDLYESENQDGHFKYVKTKQIMFVSLLSDFNYRIDTHRKNDGDEFCNVVIRNMAAEGEGFAAMAASLILSSFDKKNANYDPMRTAVDGDPQINLSMSWYDCKTAVRIKETFKAIDDKLKLKADK